MEITNSMFIRNKARELVGSCLNNHLELWRGKVINDDEILLHAPAKIASKYGFQVTEVAEIPISGILNGQKSSAEVLGEIDNQKKTIVIARKPGKSGFEQARFTLAHEVGHSFLHPGINLHREIPLNFEQGRPQLSRIEREANLFAAELLMPSDIMREQFLARFDGVVDGRQKNWGLFYWMLDNEPDLNEQEFFSSNPLYRAKQIAMAKHCFGKSVISLREFFRVSPSALAIQLIDVGLVK